MGNLTGKRIDLTYDGLIKTNDEQPIGATEKRLQDGLGNDLPVTVGTGGMTYFGTQDFSNATLSGLPIGVTYDLTAVGDGANIVLELDGSDGSLDEVVLKPGTNVSFGLVGNEITINSTGGGGGTPVTYTVGFQPNGANVDLVLTGSNGSTDSVTLVKGANMTFNLVGDQLTINSVDTNTTYDFYSNQVGNNVQLILDPSTGANDVVTLVAGSNVTLNDPGTGNITIDVAVPPKQGTIYENNQYNPGMSGYPAQTFWKFIQPISGRPYAGQSIDQSDDKTLFVRMYAEPLQTFTRFMVPMFPGNASDVTLYIYTVGPTTGQPHEKVLEITKSIGASVNDEFVEIPLNGPLVMADDRAFWIGVHSTNDRKFAMMSGDYAIGTFFTVGAGGGTIGNILGVNTLFYPSLGNPVPDTIPEPFSWQFREEITAIFYI